MDESAIDEIDRSFDSFMRPYLVSIEPLLFRTEWDGRRYTEKKVIVVMALNMGGVLTPSQLSRVFRLQKGSLTTIIRSLCAEGLVRSAAVPGDERSYCLELTERGKDLVAHLCTQRRDGFRKLFAGMTANELGAVSRGLRLVAHHLDKDEEQL